MQKQHIFVATTVRWKRKYRFTMAIAQIPITILAQWRYRQQRKYQQI